MGIPPAAPFHMCARCPEADQGIRRMLYRKEHLRADAGRAIAAKGSQMSVE
jgi:hypothetical protein